MQMSVTENEFGNSLRVFYIKGELTAVDSFDIERQVLSFRIKGNNGYDSLEEHRLFEGSPGTGNWYKWPCKNNVRFRFLKLINLNIKIKERL